TVSSVNGIAQPESPQVNVALVQESFEAFNVGDTERLLAVMAPDFVMHLAEFPEPLGWDAWREGFEMMRRAFPDLEARVEDVIAADDKVAVRISFRGTHRGEFQGIPATGGEVHYMSHEIYRIENGRFAEEWICSDTATLFRQLTEA
ncbi:MAG TPA: ester cyclase, partial [Dehalococcoidia bacterium]|nr:ester cyclase [Dehalococcoidia bacterium]